MLSPCGASPPSICSTSPHYHSQRLLQQRMSAPVCLQMLLLASNSMQCSWLPIKGAHSDGLSTLVPACLQACLHACKPPAHAAARPYSAQDQGSASLQPSDAGPLLDPDHNACLCWQAAQPGRCRSCYRQYAISQMLASSAASASLQTHGTTWSVCRRVPSLAPGVHAPQDRAAALELPAIDQMARAREDLTKVSPALQSSNTWPCGLSSMQLQPSQRPSRQNPLSGLQSLQTPWPQ